MPARERRQAALTQLVIGVAAAVTDWSIRTGGRLQLWCERRRQRRALGSLSEHMLQDIGLTRGDAGRESEVRFWRA